MFLPSLRSACHYAIGLAIAAIVLRTWLVMGLIDPVVVAGSSMTPTLHAGDRLCIDRAAFLFRSPRRWEPVVLRCPDQADEYCVKRVVGLPAESLALVDGELFVGGQRVLKKSDSGPGFRRSEPLDSGGEKPAERSWQLGADEYFVIGDNLAVSDDSRIWAAGVKEKLVVGKPMGVR